MDFLFGLYFWIFGMQGAAGQPDFLMRNEQNTIAPSQGVQVTQTDRLHIKSVQQLMVDKKTFLFKNFGNIQLQQSIIVVEDTHFKPKK